MTQLNDNVYSVINRIISPLYASLPQSSSPVTDIYINPDSRTFVTFSDMSVKEIKTTISPSSLYCLGALLSFLSSSSFSYEHPFVSSTLMVNGISARCEILIPPSVKAPSLSLRFHTIFSPRLAGLKEKGMMNTKTERLLRSFVRSKKNIIISGETGCGKTTLLNALLNEIDPSERIVIIEDGINEIRCDLPDTVNITAIDDVFSSTLAIHSALRMNPDRIIYGEIRSYDSAYETLKAWRTGHSGGISTIHASSAREIPLRLQDILFEKNKSEILHINESIDVKIHLSIENEKRVIKEIIYDDN